MKKITIYTDGGARGNPGPAGIGVQVLDEKNEVLGELPEYIGEATNNVAEYTALIKGMERLLELKIREVKVFSDSQLVIKQLNGEYHVKDRKLRELFKKVKELEAYFSNISYYHIPRERNSRADSLANMALDIKGRYPPIL